MRIDAARVYYPYGLSLPKESPELFEFAQLPLGRARRLNPSEAESLVARVTTPCLLLEKRLHVAFKVLFRPSPGVRVLLVG